ncbi:MAG: transposase [Pirellulales bacterium]|nr:transposase [Pirellulales bacterium]
MKDPIGYFMMWGTYGTWLPGDERGWVDYRHGWQLLNSVLEIEAQSRMTETACFLSVTQRTLVEEQIRETCDFREWKMFAVNCRSNHIHVVVSALHVDPKKIRNDLKAWSTRKLKEASLDKRDKWWNERGCTRYIYDEDNLAIAIEYTMKAQDRKGREQKEFRC